MKSSVYVARVLPVGDGMAPRVHVTSKEAKKSFRFLCDYVKQDGMAGYWSRVELVKHTFIGNPRTAIASAVEAGSVISRGQYITRDRFCDGVWETELVTELDCQEVANV
tara:strand:+ start:2728 stop:3054 length:327 start_codon:yes stop_codon:yes gene_type:complete